MMKKILVIDDEENHRAIIEEVLKAEGYDCVGACNGIEGVAAAKKHLPDLIVSDVMMPQLDGYGVLQTLQKDPETSLIPFIFLTGQTENTELRRGMSLGADDYLFKPFSYQELVTAVQQRLKKHDLLYNAAANKAEELKSYLNTTLPHELRTPLASIIGYLDMLNSDFDGFDAATVQMMVQQMSVSANRLSRLVENYLMYAQFMVTLKDQGVIADLRKYASCPDSCNIIIRAAEKQAAVHQRQADLVVHNLPNPALSLYPENLEKIVLELVDNALKFSPPGTPVTVEAAASSQSYILKISDHGCGMTQEQVSAVGANHQFNRARIEQQGVGLGLAIVGLICRIFGGAMKITPNGAGGTILKARLKTAPVGLPQT